MNKIVKKVFDNVMIDNHPEEVEGNPSIVTLVKDLADVDANELVVE